jgi:arsenate reductase-like glutaredoxin family protein
LRALAARASVQQLFSWKSPTARQLGITPGSRDDEELFTLMAGEPRLIRRPLVTTNDRVIIGADLKALAELG